jgi:outer membrane protein assembly factor BamB
VRATATASGEGVSVAAFDGTIVTLRAADGSRTWDRALGHGVYSSPCAAAGVLVFGCHEGHVHGLDLATGEARFVADTRGPVLASPAAIGDRILAASTDGHVYLLDPAGAILARLPLPGGAAQSSPAVEGSDVFVGGTTGVHALSLVS